VFLEAIRAYWRWDFFFYLYFAAVAIATLLPSLLLSSDKSGV
jgi:hypothetical protein